MIYFILFGIGLIFASFLNALVYRIEKEFPIKKLLFTRSECEECHKELEWYELIPVASWVLQRGKCNKCNKKITAYYPISELVLGLSFPFVYFYFDNIFYLVILCILFMLSYSDFLSKSVPQKIVHLLLLISAIFFAFNITNYISVLIFLSFSFLVYIFVKLKYKKAQKSIGLGDFYILLAISLILPYSQFISFILLLIYLSGLYSVVLVIYNRRYLKSTIPLLPFIFLSFVLNTILGEIILGMIF